MDVLQHGMIGAAAAQGMDKQHDIRCAHVQEEHGCVISWDDRSRASHGLPLPSYSCHADNHMVHRDGCTGSSGRVPFQFEY